MVRIQTFTFNPFEENTYVLFDGTGEAVVIDPGCCEREEDEVLGAFISGEKLNVKLLLNTHCHIDHVLGNDFVKRKYTVPLLIHPLEEAPLRAVSVYAPNYGFQQYQATQPDGPLAEGKAVKFGESSLEVLFLPGHSPGHVGFYLPSQKVLIGGDVLFHRSIGRTDLPGGDFDTLIQSIHQKLFTLPDDVTIYPGHGPATTIGEEKMYNPFCALSVR